MKKSKLLAIAALVILFIVALPVFTFTPTQAQVSYNKGRASKFHSPISSALQLAFTEQSPQPQVSLQNLPQGNLPSVTVKALRFISDTSYMPQSETAVDVDPSNLNHLVGGYNDARIFFCPGLPASACPSFTQSLSGFSVSADGGTTLLKSDDVPGLLDASAVAGFLQSWGDPTVAAGVDGNFFYGSLAIDPQAPSSGPFANGVEISTSNNNLWSASTPCTTSFVQPTLNACWSSKFVFGDFNGNLGTFEDKDFIAVDRSSSAFRGDVYVSWDHFDASGLSHAYLARCTSALVCTNLFTTGFGLSGGDPFAAFTTVAVGSEGNVYVTWCNYGTATTFGPIVCKLKASPPGGTSFGLATTIFSFMGTGTMKPTDTFIQGFATEQFRVASVPTLAVDTSGKSNNVYWAIDTCTAGHYYDYKSSGFPSDNPGNCGTSSIYFARSTDGGSTWSTPTVISLLADAAPHVNVQPYVTVDSVTGHVFVVYYSSRFDKFNHRLDVIARVSTDLGASFPTSLRVTSVSDDPNADPEMYFYGGAGFGGSFLVPQYGDYFEARAVNGKLWTLFTGNYASELGTLQADPYLAVTTPV